MSKIKGMQSLAFEKEVYILSAASVVGKLEGEGPLGKCFDYVEEQLFLGFSEDEKKESIELLTRMLANLDQALKETMYSGLKRHSSVEKILSKEEEIS